MKLVTVLPLAFLWTCCSTPAAQQSGTQPIAHERFTALLQKYVDEEGMVDYRGLAKDTADLQACLVQITSNPPDDNNWSENDQKAYWINAYNAFTLELVLRHYPVNSIKDIGSAIQIPFVNTPWDIKFIRIGDQKYDLNNIEHGILRKKWDDPRIHFALNCASFSCPRLRDEAYTGTDLDEQLNEQARSFINNDALNDITSEKAALSKIFDWYSGDFKKVMSLRDFVNQYADVKMTSATAITYKEYDWSLNEQD